MAKEAAMAHDARSRLGRGLAALIGDVGDEAAVLERARSQRRVPIEFLSPTRAIRAAHFAEAELDELAASIRERGIIQPILVRTARGAMRSTTRSSPASGAGARRSAPACTTCRSCCSRSSDREALELAIIENVQRTDLNALEEARGYQALADEFSYSQDEIAKIVGKSRPMSPTRCGC